MRDVGWGLLDRLEAENQKKGEAKVFARLQALLHDRTAEESYADIGRDLGLTEHTVKQRVSRMRERYRELFTEEINHTVSDPRDADDEIRHLFRVLQG